MAEQSRRVGLLKAVGGTPRLVALVLLCENGVIGLIAAGIGLLLGQLAAPSISGPGAGLLAATTTAGIDLPAVAAVTALGLFLATAATLLPTLHATRRSTVSSLMDQPRTPRRRAASIKLSAHLPAPLLVGARLAARRPRRAALTVASTTVTVSGLTAVLIMHATQANPEFIAPSDPLKARLNAAVVMLSAALTVFAVVNAVFIAWTTALEARATTALTRALGATAGEIVAGLSATQGLLTLIGAILGIPCGIGIYYAFTPHGATTTVPPAPSLALVVLFTPLAVSLLTIIPVRIGARGPVAHSLKATG